MDGSARRLLPGPILPDRLAAKWVLFLLMCLGAAQPIANAQQVAPASGVSSPGRQVPHPLDPALELSRESLAHFQANVRDYTALFVKRTRVDGELSQMQHISVKIRNPKMTEGKLAVPMGVYLRFLKPDAVKGRELIWVQGQNDGKLMVHQAGLLNLATLKLAPDSYLAMRGQRYPVTDIGIENLTKKLIATAERDRRYGECEVKFFPNAKVGAVACRMIQVTHAVKRPHFDFYRAQVYFSRELNAPIRYVSWSWPVAQDGEPVLEEEYNYLHVRTNVGLTSLDFDPENPDYQFR